MNTDPPASTETAPPVSYMTHKGSKKIIQNTKESTMNEEGQKRRKLRERELKIVTVAMLLKNLTLMARSLPTAVVESAPRPDTRTAEPLLQKPPVSSRSLSVRTPPSPTKKIPDCPLASIKHLATSHTPVIVTSLSIFGKSPNPAYVSVLHFRLALQTSPSLVNFDDLF